MKDELSPNVATVSRGGLRLLCSAALLAALSALSHTHMHTLSTLSFSAANLLGFFALVKVTNQLAIHLPRPLKRLIHWGRALTFECLGLLVVALLRLASLRKEGKPSGNSTGRPILLVHGYCNHSSVWIYLLRQLAKAGLGPIYTIDLGRPFHSIREHAEKLQSRINTIQRETGRSDLALIGHSMGGLVSAVCATTLGTSTDCVIDVITIGSPLQGTHMARLALGESGREMRRDSKLLIELAKNINHFPNIRFHHIASRTDQLVIPSESALSEDTKRRQFILEDIGHASMLFSPRVAAKLIEWLQ